MDRQLRFAVVTAFLHDDWHSQRVFAALSQWADTVIVDPADLSASLEPGALALRHRERLEDFDAFVLVRGLSPRGDADAQFTVYRALAQAGALVINRIDALLDAQDKFRTSHLLARAGVPTPRAALAQSGDAAAEFLRRLGDAVAKPLFGSLGEGVERLAVGEEGERRAAERVAAEGALYLQQWVPNPGHDTRAFVVGGRMVASVERVAAEGEFRTNVARGARPRPAHPNPGVASVAERAARALGLDYAGVDVLEGPQGPQVIEVNGNPSFDMIFDATGQDMGVEIARYVVRQARERWQRSGAVEGPGLGPPAAPT
ncbi:MAG: RimK family alpha-L-glutamate ligase [Myxococcales bacterium]